MTIPDARRVVRRLRKTLLFMDRYPMEGGNMRCTRCKKVIPEGQYKIRNGMILCSDCDMRCNRCKKFIPNGEEIEFSGQVLCSDCYRYLHAPFRQCNPWKSIRQNSSIDHAPWID